MQQQTKAKSIVSLHELSENFIFNERPMVITNLRLLRASDCFVDSGGASAVKEPGHFEVRKSSSQVTQMHFFPHKKLTTFLVVSPSKHPPPTPLIVLLSKYNK